MKGLWQRPTAELIVLFLCALIGITVLTTVALMVVHEIQHPEADVSGFARALADLTNTLIAVIVGYIAGNRARPGDPKV